MNLQAPHPQLSVQASVIEEFLVVIAAYINVCHRRGFEPKLSREDLDDIVRFCDLYPGGWQRAIEVAFSRVGNSCAGARDQMVARYAQGRGAMA